MSCVPSGVRPCVRLTPVILPVSIRTGSPSGSGDVPRIGAGGGGVPGRGHARHAREFIGSEAYVTGKFLPRELKRVDLGPDVIVAAVDGVDIFGASKTGLPGMGGTPTSP